MSTESALSHLDRAIRELEDARTHLSYTKSSYRVAISFYLYMLSTMHDDLMEELMVYLDDRQRRMNDT